MQEAPQPHGPAVCFLENDDLDRRIPNVWGFQLSDSVTTQSLLSQSCLHHSSTLPLYPRIVDCHIHFRGCRLPASLFPVSVPPSPPPLTPVSSTALLRLASVSFVVLLPVPMPSQLLPPVPAPCVSMIPAPAPSVSSLPVSMPPLSLLLALIPVSPTPLRPAPVPTAVVYLVEFFLHPIHLHLSVNNLWLNHELLN